VLTVNADDLGRDADTNQAILAAFNAGYCSSATIMPTMPGFEEACGLVHRNKLGDCIGLHLTLRDCFPLTDRMKACPRFCDSDGVMSKASVFAPVFLSSDEERILAGEVRAQIRRCRHAGLRLTHLDSHYHIHTNFSLINAIVEVAAEEHIPYVRLARNAGRSLGIVKSTLKKAFNNRLKARGLAATNYFGSVEDYVYLTSRVGLREPKLSMEIMVHPILNKKRQLVDRDGEPPLNELVAHIAQLENTVSYGFVHQTYAS
jgi:predicted glycoside hydrolase/deacetylase ChbG (UPF0249 family)